MAKFTPGMKVKRVRDPGPASASLTDMPIGATGVVTQVEWDLVHVLPDHGKPVWGCLPETLEPILPERDEAYERFLKTITTTAPLVEYVRALEKA